MERLIKKLTRLIAQAMTDAAVSFEVISSGRVCGKIVWDGFRNLDSLERQELLAKILYPRLNAGEQLKLSHIATLTKSEAVRTVHKDTLKRKLRRALASRFKGAKLELERYSENGISGDVIWSGFRRWDHDKRNKILNDTLEKELTDEERRQVWLMTLTPRERLYREEDDKMEMMPLEDY